MADSQVPENFQHFLDNQQYTRSSILKYEKVFDSGFISPGGLKVTQGLLKALDLNPDDYVLEVGAGIGGAAFFLAETFDVRILGIDLSSNMIRIAKERSALKEDARVTFEECDITEMEFPPNSFDVIFSRDTILHIKDKASLFNNFFKWLRPGGQLAVTDYCCSDATWSQKYIDYVTQRRYHVITPLKYGQMLKEAGFTEVKAEDATERFIDVLQAELSRLQTIESEFIQEFSNEDYSEMEDSWRSKLERCREGHQRWGNFFARKPL